MVNHQHGSTDPRGRAVETQSATGTKPPAETLTAVVDQLCGSRPGSKLRSLRGPGHEALPSRDAVIAIVENLRSALFPGYFGTSELTAESMRFHVGSTLDHVSRALHEQILRGLCFTCTRDNTGTCPECDARALDISHRFLERLPGVQKLLFTDATAAYLSDPAATSPDEAVFCYPGILAITNFRLAHELHLLGVPLIPRMITEHAHSITGIDIHPGASIDEGFFIDHGTGVVVGETSEIGKQVRIYQGVTLGAKSFALDEHGNPIKGIPRHPIVEDNVVIYAGATLLGRIRIGKDSVIGGNVWLTRNVPPGSHISQAQVRAESFEWGGGI
jgi:serine O-acetyltransferase